jgi:hypothetical protein
VDVETYLLWVVQHPREGGVGVVLPRLDPTVARFELLHTRGELRVVVSDDACLGRTYGAVLAEERRGALERRDLCGGC